MWRCEFWECLDAGCAANFRPIAEFARRSKGLFGGQDLKKVSPAKALGASAFLIFLAILPLALIAHLAFKAHDRRIDVLASGQLTSAVVTRSHRHWTRGGCGIFEYKYAFRRVEYLGGEGGCPLIATHPVGSEVKIRFDPFDPETSVAIGAELWPGWGVIPILFVPFILLFAVFVIYATTRDTMRNRRKNRKTRKV
jgi:hypothetical protein